MRNWRVFANRVTYVVVATAEKSIHMHGANEDVSAGMKQHNKCAIAGYMHVI